MEKRFLLFDADRTLLDFATSERNSLKQAFAAYELPFSDEVYRFHLQCNAKLWEDYEKGLIDRQEVLYTRFVRLFAHFGYQRDGAAFEDCYRHYLECACDLLPEAMEVVQTLSRTHLLYLVTNGVADTQRKRMRDSGLEPYFQGLFISEEIGWQKPKREFFDICFAHIPDFQRAHALIIGDSLTSDIKGGNAAGIETCWFNPEGKKNNTDARVDYEIRSLTELYRILHIGSVQKESR